MTDVTIDQEKLNKILQEKAARLEKQDNVHSIATDSYSAVVVVADKIKPKQQPWFWEGIIPLDTTTLFAGYGGIGKSQLLLFFAAHTSTGASFTAGGGSHAFPQGGVIILSGEDDFEYQLIPKLIAANANREKIYLLKMMKAPGRPTALLDLDAHLFLLEETIVKAKAENNTIKLIVIDPVQYFTGEMKDHINANVCRFISALNDLAKKYNLAIIMNKHLRKSKGGADMQGAATDAVSGSAAWTTSPRACCLIHPHPTDNDKVLFATDLKANLQKRGSKSFAFKIDRHFITDDEGKSIATTLLSWFDQMEDIGSDEALNTPKVAAAEQSIRQWIINFLLQANETPNNGAMYLSADLYSEALKADFKKSHYYEIKNKMIKEGIISEVLEGKVRKAKMIKLNDPEMHTP